MNSLINQDPAYNPAMQPDYSKSQYFYCFASPTFWNPTFPIGYTPYRSSCFQLPTSQLSVDTYMKNSSSYLIDNNASLSLNQFLPANERRTSAVGNKKKRIHSGDISPCSEKNFSKERHQSDESYAFDELSNCSTHSSNGTTAQEMKSKDICSFSKNDLSNDPFNGSIPGLSSPSSSMDQCKDMSQDEKEFYQRLYQLMREQGQPIQRLPTLGFKELDLYKLFKQVTSRGGVDYVIAKKQWKEVADALELPASCTDSGFRLRLHYMRYLERYERKYFVPPPKVIESLRKYRGRKLGNLYSKDKTKPSGCRRIAEKMGDISHTDTSLSAQDRRTFNDGQKIEKKRKSHRSESTAVASSTNEYQDTLQLDEVLPYASSMMDYDTEDKKHLSQKQAAKNISLQLFKTIEESSVQKYIRHYISDEEKSTNAPFPYLVELAAQHFSEMKMTPLEENETILQFLRVLTGT